MSWFTVWVYINGVLRSETIHGCDSPVEALGFMIETFDPFHNC